jgi:hypothetical protein
MDWMDWNSGEVTLLLPGGVELETPGFIHGDGEVAIAEYQGKWLVLRRRSGLELGRFDTKDVALDLGHRLVSHVSHVSQNLERPPEDWAEGFWELLEKIRAEASRENGLPPPPPLRPDSIR